MRRGTEFVDVLLRGADPSPELLGAFALGLLMVGIVSNFVYDLLTAPGTSLATGVSVALATAGLTSLAYLLYRRDRLRKPAFQADVDESRLAPPHAGLIWILGPGPLGHLLFALDHHRRGGGGEHCWLVMQDTPNVQRAFNELARHLTDRQMPTRLHPVYIDRVDVQTAYEAVRTILDREATEEGLRPDQVIADITGGFKPLTAGMLLAALTTGGALEYVESDRDDQGNPIPDTLRVVLVDTRFYLTEES